MEIETFHLKGATKVVIADYVVDLDSSSQQWRIIQWCSPEGLVYRYLTNDFTLEPGEVAFLYYWRWDEEKYSVLKSYATYTIFSLPMANRTKR